MGKFAALRDNIDALLDAISCGLLITDRQGTVMFANDAFANLYSLPHALTTSGTELADINRHILSCLAHPPEDMETEAAAMADRILRDSGNGSGPIEQLRLKCGRTIEIRGRRLDGGLVVLSHADRVSQSATGAGFIGSEETLRAVIEDQTEMICRFDNEFRLTFVNRAYCEAFGKSEQDLIGSVFLELIADENVRRELAASLLELSPRTPVLHGDYPERSPDGTIVWHSWANRALFDDDGMLREFQAVGRDITVERNMFEALEASEARLRDIADANPVPLVIFDRSGGTILYMNPAAETIFEGALTISEILCKPGDLAKITDFIHRAGRIDLYELEACRPGGETFFAEASGRKIAFQDHDAVALGVLDVSERKRAEEEIARQRQALAQSEKLNAMGALLASVSHELNNPLSIIVGQSRLLQEISGDQNTTDHAERIVRAAERCSRIVKTFLGMARQRPPQREPVDANGLIRSAVELVDYPLRTAGIDLILSLDGDGPVISADQDQLIQVIVNMLINAQQALVEQPQPRTVEITTAQSDGNLVIDVEDNGPGITENLFDTVFEPYFTTKPEGFGTGVGLAVTRNIVQFHEGTISAGQSRLGGALFRVLLPLSETVAVPRPEPGQATSLPPLRILVVDDEADIATTLKGDLGAEGHVISVAADGFEALQLLRTNSYDVVVSDIRMPRMDGREFYRKIVEHKLIDPLRIGFMTGDTLNASVREFLDRSGAPVIEKPIHSDDLRGLLTQLIQDERPLPS